jgi:hypothetical protein
MTFKFLFGENITKRIRAFLSNSALCLAALKNHVGGRFLLFAANGTGNRQPYAHM